MSLLRTTRSSARPRTPPADLLVRGAHVLDPRAGLDGAARRARPRRARSPRSARPGRSRRPTGAEVVDGEGRHALPGFVDPHVHLRTPGQEHKEDLETGTRAAAAGGFCPVIAMPNTDPVVDSPSILGALRETARARGARSRSASWARSRAGCAARSSPRWRPARGRRARLHRRRQARSSSAGMLRRALQYQRLCGGVLALHEEDPQLSGAGRDARGRRQRRCSASRASPRSRESTMVARDAAIAGYEGGARPHPAPQLRRVGRGGRAGEGARRTASPARPARTTSAHRRGRPHARHAA